MFPPRQPIYLSYLYLFNFYSVVYPVAIALASRPPTSIWTTALTRVRRGEKRLGPAAGGCLAPGPRPGAGQGRPVHFKAVLPPPPKKKVSVPFSLLCELDPVVGVCELCDKPSLWKFSSFFSFIFYKLPDLQFLCVFLKPADVRVSGETAYFCTSCTVL